jgi:hypothetical protein
MKDFGQDWWWRPGDCTTAAITLSGEQTVDGVALVTGDRCLVNNQADQTTNGIYKVDTGAWSRTLDCDGSYDLVQGSAVHVYSGTNNGSKIWRCTTGNISATSPYVNIGSASISFSAMDVQLLGSSKSVWCGTATGGPNALVLSPGTALIAGDIVAGLTLVFKKDAADNTGAVTINVSGTGAVAGQADGAAMVGGEMKASKWFAATLDGSGTAYQVRQIAPAVLLSLFTGKGVIVAGSAAGAVVAKAAGADNTLVGYDSTQASGLRTFTLAGTLSATAGVLTGGVALQADQETGSSLVLAVTPGRQQFHPSAAKAWAQANFAGTAPASYNVSSVTDTGTGDMSINWTTSFSSTAYCVVATVIFNAAGSTATTLVAQLKNTLSVSAAAINSLRVSDGAVTDGSFICAAAYGDQ